MTNVKKIEHTGRVIRDEIRIEASPEDVYRAWTEPDGITGWFISRMDGRMEVGESVTWFWESTGTGMTQRIVDLDPPHKIIAAMDLPDGVSHMELTIEQDGGHSILRIVQSGFGEGPDWDDQYEGMMSGWMVALGVLKLFLERYNGRPRREILVLGDGPYEPDQIRKLQRTEGGLAKWLTESGAPGTEVGDPVHLVLAGGRTLTGKVLRNTPYEALWSWDEIDGVVELKAFRGAHWGSKVGVRLSSWADDESLLSTLEAPLSAAIERLTIELAGGPS